MPVKPSAGNGNGGQEYQGGNTLLTYIIGGIIAWGLIGWGLDYLLNTRWLFIVGAVLGAGGGYYLARKHNLTRSARRRHGDGRGNNN
ncbi:AtpZ/AtpI family protein [Crystallibacter crystallopoietes]|nr:AtpZ/AtpI family protein [Arthrobacter crystallopoietes]